MENEKLQLIPKIENYMQYEIEMLIKLPRTEKFSIGTEMKICLYKMLENVMLFNKISKKSKEKQLESINLLNKIDTYLNIQRIYLRIMCKNKWIDEKKFKISMEKIYEIGKILGGLMKYYAKKNAK